MSLFDNGEPEEILMFVRNFNMTLAASGTLEADTKFQYLSTLVRGEDLSQFESFSADVESTQNLHVYEIIKDLAQYFPPVNSLLKQKRAMRRGTNKPRALTVRRYTARLIDLNEYLASFPGATLKDKMDVTKLNYILLNSMPNIWSRQAYVQGFDCEYITFKKAVNMFDNMEISYSICEGVVEHSYK